MEMAKKEKLAQIIAGCKSGNEQSYCELVDIYSGRCFGYFYRLSSDRTISEDLLSKLFVKLVTKIKTFKDGSFDGWLFTIALNIFRDFLRDKQREKKLLEHQSQRVEEDYGYIGHTDDERIDKLQLELNKLDADTKEVLTLRYYSGLGFKEIAQMRAEPIGTTLSKAHRGIEKLKQALS